MTLRKFFYFGIIVCTSLSLTHGITRKAQAKSSVDGKILLQVESRGEAWYVNPVDGRRYYLKDGTAAYDIMRSLGLGITNKNLSEIPVGAEPSTRGSQLLQQLRGRIVLQVESHGEAWYIDPSMQKRIYLRDGQAAYDLMRSRGLGITNADLAKIPIGSRRISSKAAALIRYSRRQVTAKDVAYTVDILTVSSRDPAVQISTHAATALPCSTDCPAQSLKSYVDAHGAYAAANGTYFCAATYPECQTKKNYYFYPVYDSVSKSMVNNDQLRYPTTGALVVFDTKGKPYFFSTTREFGSVDSFEKRYGATLIAGIGNAPLLRYNNTTVLNRASLDTKQATVKSTRTMIATMGDMLYFVAATKATVSDMADLAEAMGMDNALNLDGGGSSALYYDGSYKVGPGRNIPNAILFSIRED